MVTAQQVYNAIKEKFSNLEVKVTDISSQIKRSDSFAVIFYGFFIDPDRVRYSLRNFMKNQLGVTCLITYVKENKK